MERMSKWERVEAALRGEEVDRVPVGFWRHYFLQEWAPRRLAELTHAFHQEIDTDFVKLTPSGIYPLQDWGPTIRFGRDDNTSPEYVEAAVPSAEGWADLPRLNVRRGAWGRELETLRHLAGMLDDEAPLLMTIYSPLTIASMLCWERRSRDRIVEDLRGSPDLLHKGLRTIAAAVTEYAAACLEVGATGLFFATQMSSCDVLTREEYEEFGAAYDLPILESARDRARVIMLHACRQNIMFDLVAGYPVDVVHWDDRAGKPSLAEARERTGKAISGGLSRETLLHGTEQEVMAEARDAIHQTGGKGFILGAGCVINTRTPVENLRATRHATELLGS